jgi:lipopolysaccharide/colanic/teichoic acid biosynthesis glycosyltransferase
MYQIRPGITGWAQINGRDVLAAQPVKKASFDAYYLHKFSLWLDIKIFFLTIVRVFKSDDVAEGVLTETEQTPAQSTIKDNLKEDKDQAV